MPRPRNSAFVFLAGAALAVSALSAGCASRSGSDSLVRASGGDGGTIVGSGLRLADVNDPASGLRPENFPAIPWDVSVTGAAVTALDTYDETRDGKSVGTLYFQDVGATGPWGGMSTFGQTFIPGSFRVAPGDVLDFSGTYQENKNIGTAIFNEGTFLPQMFRPSCTLRFESAVPAPIDIDVEDLRTFETGRKWVGMLVRVHGITVSEDMRTDRVGRISGKLLAGTDRNLPTFTNELTALAPGDYPAGTELKSITGIVTFFFNLHLAPRGPSDIER